MFLDYSNKRDPKDVFIPDIKSVALCGEVQAGRGLCMCMKETRRRRITVTSSLNESIDQLVNRVGAIGAFSPPPFYSRRRFL